MQEMNYKVLRCIKHWLMLYWPELSVPSVLSAHSGHLLVLWCRDVCVRVLMFPVFYIKTHTPGV